MKTVTVLVECDDSNGFRGDEIQEKLENLGDVASINQLLDDRGNVVNLRLVETFLPGRSYNLPDRQADKLIKIGYAE